MLINLLILWSVGLFLLPDIIALDDRSSWIAQQVSMLLLVWALFVETSPLNIARRCALGVFVILMADVALTDWAFDHFSYPIRFLEVLVFLMWFSWTIYRPYYHTRGDDIDKHNIFITFYRPQTSVETLISLMGLPFTSVGVYAYDPNDGDRWLRFRRNQPSLKILKVRPTRPRYFCVNTGIKYNKKYKFLMEDLEGTPARHWTSLYLRCRCIVALSPLLAMLGDEWRPRLIEYFPGVYAYRRIINGRRSSGDNTRRT